MKALTVAQPWASLIVAGVKTIETRPSPPNGSMRPDGVRGLPGLAIEPGERIAIHAAATRPVTLGDWYVGTAYGEWCARRPTTRPGDMFATHETVWLPLGAIVGTVVVADALPIVSEDVEAELPCIEVGFQHMSVWWPSSGAPGDEANEMYTTDQLPLGDYRPGRWGWLLTDPQSTTSLCPACLDEARPGSVCKVCSDLWCADPVPVRGRQGVWEWTP